MNDLFTITADHEPSARGGFAVVQFIQRYLQYRHVGFGRLAALRFAWMLVHASPGRPLSIR